MEMYFKRMKDEWTGLVEQADPLIRAKAAEIAVTHAHYLSIEFYRIVRIDPHAEEFLSNEQFRKLSPYCANCSKRYRATKLVWMC